jgi:hypothetical protein
MLAWMRITVRSAGDIASDELAAHVHALLLRRRSSHRAEQEREGDKCNGELHIDDVVDVEVS